MLESLIWLVSNHAVSIKAKAVEHSLPVPRAEQERLNYKKAREESGKKAEQEKLNEEKTRKLKEAEIVVENLVSKIEEFEHINNPKNLPVSYPIMKLLI